jgi:putative PIN family toxin of toxin-antitoxin system
MKNMQSVMVDTSTLFSGLLFRGKPHQILDLIRRKKAKLILPDYVLAELYRLIRRQEPSSVGIIDAFLFFTKPRIVSESKYRKFLRQALKLVRDDEDAPVLACALHVKPDFFISSDKDFHTKEIKNMLT